MRVWIIFLFLYSQTKAQSRPQGWPFSSDPSIPVNISPAQNPLFSNIIPDSVIRDYSPLVYLHSEENFFPSDVDYFLDNVNIDPDYMTTKEPLECESCTSLT
ncbi:unnamed protein product, partial [Brachionus calyciflorus]